MNKRFLAILGCLVLTAFSGMPAWAQENDEEADERVKYTLILPEEKTPELVKPEENNPFEAISDGSQDDDSSSEENQVRDLLLRMSVGGAASGINGMRVMLGGMRLEPGMEVPPVIPDQQVVLRVKSITASTIELVWVEKKPTGLPPKLLVIPMDGSPTVRYRMPAGGAGSMRRSTVSAFSPAPGTNTSSVATVRPAEPVPAAPPAAPKTQSPVAPQATPPPANVPEASVIRMLFGNRPPEAK